MTPAIGRLKTRPEFLRVASAGRKWAVPGLVLQARPRGTGEAIGTPGGTSDATSSDLDLGGQGDLSSGNADIRYGLTASRKVGGAVVRNRARRRLRSAALEVLPNLGRPGTDYVLIARAETVSRSYRDLLQDLRVALDRVATMKPRAPGSRRRRPGAEGRKKTRN